MTKKTKILIIGLSSKLGGIETFIFNLLNRHKKENVEIFLLSFDDEKCCFEDELKEQGYEFIYIKSRNKNYFKYLRDLRRIIKNGNFDYIHYNLMSFSMYEPIKYAKKYKTKIIIHSHTSKISNDCNKILNKIGIIYAKKCDSINIACSNESGRNFFDGQNYLTINNGIDFSRFYYKEKYRMEIRKKYKISNDSILLGHIGRFSKVKNHEFLLNLMEELKKTSKNYKMIFVGDGELKEKIILEIKNRKLENDIIILPNLKDVEKIYSAIDCLLLPSLYEGIPFVAIEGQVNGVKIIASDKISNEVKLTNNIELIKLDTSMWIKSIKQNKIKRDKIYKINNQLNSYNIENLYKKIFNIYTNSKKYKIGILTYHNSNNFGALLQSYALQKMCYQIFPNVEFVNYRKKEIYEKSPIKLIFLSLINLKINKFIVLILGYFWNASRYRKMNVFRKKYLKISKRVNKFTDFEKIKNNYSVFITGSDQVWNKNITKGIDKLYFLDFDSQAKLISYAPSTGGCEFTKKEKIKINEILNSYAAISLREKSTIYEFQTFINRKINEVIDPTLLLEKEDWECLINKTKLKPKYKYILVYTVEENSNLVKFVNKLSSKLNIGVVYFTKRNFYDNGIKSINNSGIEDFLYWFNNATYIVTNSFHGCVFSIIFEKEFFAFNHSTRGNRIGDLLSICKIENRLINNNYNVIFDNINYNKVKENLLKYKVKSIEYLFKSINEK